MHRKVLMALMVLMLTVCVYDAVIAQESNTRYVDSDGGIDQSDCVDASSPCASIGYALEQADDGDTLFVATGSYVENILISRNVAIVGGYETVDSSWIFSPHSRSIIQAGGAAVDLPAFIFAASSDGASLSRFIITDSVTSTSGRSAVVVNSNAAVTIDTCTITGNTTSGVTQEWGAGGLLIHNDASVTMRRTIITDNSTDGGAGGIRLGAGDLTLTDSLIFGNVGRVAIHTNEASMTLGNITIADHGTHGAIFLNQSEATIQNSIIWEELGPDVEAAHNSNYVISYSNVHDGVPDGVGNISALPLFRSPNEGDYHLERGSPSIDTGSLNNASAYDLDGNPRLGTPDMGAYELNQQIYLPLVDAN